jgi:ADP-heptose:LPS heptosyltransferase
MQPNTMRRIDFWAGVPISFLLTLADRLLRLAGVGHARPGERPRNVLLVQLAEMGTMVVAYPAIRKLKELLPEARIHFLTFEDVRPSLEVLEVIDRGDILTINSKSFIRLVRDSVKFLWKARSRNIDTVINLETFVRYSTILSFLAGARTRVGFHRFNLEGAYTGDLLTHPVWYNPHIHAGHTFLDLVHALEAPPGQVPLVKRPRANDRLSVPRIASSDTARERVWKILRDRNPDIDGSKTLVVLNPNASDRFPMRQLPLRDYAKLARKLLEDPEVFVLITGVEREKPTAARLISEIGCRRAVDLAGGTTFSDLMSLYDVADVLVTTDSGPAHFACLTPIHIVVFFGPELPDRYRPLSDRCDVVYAGYTCSPCVGPQNQRLSPCNENLCLQNFDLDAVHLLIRDRVRSRRES